MGAPPQDHPRGPARGILGRDSAGNPDQNPVGIRLRAGFWRPSLRNSVAAILASSSTLIPCRGLPWRESGGGGRCDFPRWH
jgi:hypothetical protein